MKIFTSYYKKIADNPRGLIPVRISTTKPEWFTGCVLALPDLYPGMVMVENYKSGLLSDEEYKRVYKKKLKELNPLEIIKKLEKISSRFGNRDIVLLCYETPDKLCHRHLVAEWLIENTEYEVKELE